MHHRQADLQNLMKINLIEKYLINPGLMLAEY